MLKALFCSGAEAVHHHEMSLRHTRQPSPVQQAGEAACTGVWMRLLELLEVPMAHTDLPLCVHRAVRRDDHMILVAQSGYDAVLCVGPLTVSGRKCQGGTQASNQPPHHRQDRKLGLNSRSRRLLPHIICCSQCTCCCESMLQRRRCVHRCTALCPELSLMKQLSTWVKQFASLPV